MTTTVAEFFKYAVVSVPVYHYHVKETFWSKLRELWMIRNTCKQMSKQQETFGNQVSLEPEKYDYDKLIDCAAIKGADGIVWTGHRHGHCFKTIEQMKKLGYEPKHPYVQGFVTMSGRFVDRKEAAVIAVHAGQAKLTLPCELFSEDLY